MHLLILWLACTPAPPVDDSAEAAPPAVEAAEVVPEGPLAQDGYGLYELVDQATLDLPERSWPGEVPERFSPSALPVQNGRLRVALQLPPSITRAHLISGGSAFQHAPADVEVRVRGEVVPFSPRAKQAETWGLDDKGILLHLASAPSPEEVEISLPELVGLQRAMEPDPAHVRHRVRTGFRSNKGLLLPAPASATWSLTVPDHGHFISTVRILPPALPSPASSDGATAVVELLDGDTVVASQRVELTGTKPSKLQLPVAKHAGKTLDLRLSSEPGETATLDYVFFGAPLVHAKRAEGPRRVVLLFLDTLRRDHLGVYGYEARPVSPAIDAFAQTATVFDDARTVAPWTLPSVRTALTGHQPERWADVPNLAEVMSQAGWATVARSTNAFVSATFQMDRGWDAFELTGRQPAPELADYAERVLGWYKDRDLLLMLQFMDAHTPYEEAEPYRSMFLEDEPADTHFLERLRKLDPEDAGFGAKRDYVEARYDQNIRAIDDAVARVLSKLDDKDLVVIFSDHGEEFWEHGGFEHGHAFWDELLRVPFIIRSPKLPPGRVDEPVSLLDLTPTLLDLLDLPIDAQGSSLRGVAHGEAQAAKALTERPLGFGRPLYGADGWGVLTGGHKWFTRGGMWAVYNLAEDPEERSNIARPNTLRGKPEALSESLQRPVHEVWRVQMRAGPKVKGVTWEIRHPDGLEDAWFTYDPRGRFAARDVSVEDGVVRVHTAADGAYPAAVEVRGPEGRSAEGLEVVVLHEGRRIDGVVKKTGAVKRVMLNLGDRLLGAIVERTWSPEPTSGVVRAFDESMAAELEALGYVE